MLKAMHHDSAAGRAKGSFFPLKPLHLTDTHPTRLVHSLQQREQRPVRTKGREIKTFLCLTQVEWPRRSHTLALTISITPTSSH